MIMYLFYIAFDPVVATPVVVMVDKINKNLITVVNINLLILQ